MDLLINKDTGDLAFLDGMCPVTRSRTHAVAQRVYVRLRTFLGEWYLSESYGTPWLERVLGHKVDKGSVDMIIQSEVLDVEGVDKILSFSSERTKDRKYSCRIVIQSDEGGVSDEINIVQ